METTAVRVALRIRPLAEKEQATTESLDSKCITCAKDEPQVFLGKDRAFTFDHVYPPETSQTQVFETSIKGLLDCFLDGNNATVLAYGQTGSGKTYSIGTSVESFPDSESQGIIQRFARALFERLEQEKSATTSQLYVSYVELYNEEIIDLLCPPTAYSTTTTTGTIEKDETKHPTIREDIYGQIHWTGVREIPVYNIHGLLEYVKKGSLSRSTGTANMNSSSRSHAIISITLKQQISDLDHANEPQKSVKRLVSKFQFVDLAGSERLKRTNALGDRQKEGISINTGLLALGNVISALGDETRRGSHVPYIDSKLTRLLQDSLGGNSHTLILACISPSPSDYMETLNTLKYASRARNIQNRVEINVDYDDSLDEVNHLKSQLGKLRSQLSSLRHLQHRQQQHDTSQRHSCDHQSVNSESVRAKMHTPSMDNKELADLQTERNNLTLQYDTIQDQPLTMEYLQHIQDLKFELTEANNRLIHLETQHEQQQLQQELHHQQASISAALPGRFGSNSPTYRRNKTALSTTCSLDKAARTGSLSTGGRRAIKHRKHSLPIGQRMKSTRKHGTVMTAPNSPPNFDDLWRFLDSDSTDSNLTEIREDNHSASSRQEVKDETQYQNEKRSTANATLPSPHSSNDDSLVHTPSTKLDISPLSKIPSSSSLLPDSPVSTTVGHDLNLHDDDDDVQLLAVPSWTDEPKTQSVTDSTKRESLSWTDSLLDDSDMSIATSRLSSTYWNTTHNGKRNGGRRRSKDLLKILHQVQADLLVKKELVGQLEKSEDEYTQMRINYEDQLKSLEKHLVDMRYQRDYAIGEIEIGDMNIANMNNHPDNTSGTNSVINKEVDQQHQVTKPKTATTHKQKMHSTLSPPPPPAQRQPLIGLQRRPQDATPRQIREIRLQYEGKIKRLTNESQEWKRKYIQTTNSMTSARTRAEQVVTKLRSTIDQMKMEKKQLQRTMKQDNDRLREQLAAAEQEIQQLKRKEVGHLDARKKLDDTNEQQQVMLKKRHDQTLQVNQQMRQLNAVLRKAANEGTFLNEAALERLLTQASALSASPLQRQLSRSPPLPAMD